MTAQSGPAAPPTAPAGGSIGDALGAVSRDLSELVRQEIELAKAEARESAVRLARSAGLVGGAVVAAVFTLLFLSYALWALLDESMPSGWAAVVVALVWAVIAASLAAVGRQQMRSAPGLEQTKESVREIPRALKGEETTR